MAISQNTYDKTRRVKKVLFQQATPVADYELNEVQDIIDGFLGDTREFSGAFGFWGDGFYVEPTGSPNEITVRRGLMITGDSVIILPEDVTVTGLTTPGSSRTDHVYLLVKLTEKTKSQYPNIINPLTGQSLAKRLAYDITVGVAEDADYSSVDVDAEDQLIVFATLSRAVASDTVIESEITDARDLYSRSLVLGKQDNACLFTSTGGLGFDLEGGEVKVFGENYTVSPVSSNVADDALSFLIVTEAGSFSNSTTIPTGKFLELWRITAAGGAIVNIEDRRRFVPGGLTGGAFTQDGSLDLTAFRALYASPTSPPSMQVQVNAGQASYGPEALSFPGGNSATFVAPGGATRIDLLYLDNTGALAVSAGAEGSGVPPSHTGFLPIAEITLDVGQTSILRTDIRDVRPLFNLGSVGSLNLADLLDVSTDLSAAVRDTGVLRAASATAANPLATFADVPDILSDLSDVSTDLSAAVRDTGVLRVSPATALNPLATIADVTGGLAGVVTMARVHAHAAGPAAGDFGAVISVTYPVGTKSIAILAANGIAGGDTGDTFGMTWIDVSSTPNATAYHGYSFSYGFGNGAAAANGTVIAPVAGAVVGTTPLGFTINNVGFLYYLSSLNTATRDFALGYRHTTNYSGNALVLFLR